jgi:hypothetical protein
VSSSRVGKTSPVSKAVSTASFKNERPGVCRAFLMRGSSFQPFRRLPLPD